MIINDQYRVQGAQPPDVFLDIFEKLLEQAV
jgi:predicted DsbA family dithiol-disulfide isomerase